MRVRLAALAVAVLIAVASGCESGPTEAADLHNSAPRDLAASSSDFAVVDLAQAALDFASSDQALPPSDATVADLASVDAAKQLPDMRSGDDDMAMACIPPRGQCTASAECCGGNSSLCQGQAGGSSQCCLGLGQPCVVANDCCYNAMVPVTCGTNSHVCCAFGTAGC
jgi:hypothetical protein